MCTNLVCLPKLDCQMQAYEKTGRPSNLHTYVHIYIPASAPTTYLPNHPPTTTHQSTNQPTYLSTYLPTHPLGETNKHLLFQNTPKINIRMFFYFQNSIKCELTKRYY